MLAQNKKPAAKKTKPAAKTGKKNQNTETESKYMLTEQDLKIKSEIKLLLSLALMALLFISNFGLLPPVGNYISYFMFGMTGILAYLLPVLIFLSTAFLIANRKNKRAYIKFASAFLLIWLFLAMVQMIFFGYQKDRNCFYYYFYCGEHKSGGGFFGALIANTLCHIVGEVGAWVLLFIFFIICGVILTEKSFSGGVKKGSRIVYESAREDVTRIRQSGKDWSKEKEYQKNRRIHKVAKGVNLSRIEDPSHKQEGMHEITEDSFKEPEEPHELPVLIQTKPTRKKTMAQRSTMINLERPAQEIEPPEDISPAETAEEAEEYVPPFQEDVPVKIPSYKSTAFVSHIEDVEEDVTEEPDLFKDSADTEKVYIDEEGNYKAKEQIIVPDSAKKVMNRPAFSVSNARPVISAAKNAEKETVDNRNKNDLGADGMVEIATADVKNSVYEAEPVRKPVKPMKNRTYLLPRTSLLNKNQENSQTNLAELQETAAKLNQILENFGVKASVIDFHRGPSVTRYEIQPEIGTRLNKITTLADDIKLNLAATDIRIEPIPGKPTIGIEVPNKVRESVLLRDLIESKELVNHKSKLAFGAGKDIAGQVIAADISKMPHFLIAGTTGSGKSVFTNSIIMSILFRATPDEVRLIIIDPKVVEFSIYNGIPHLLQPVVTDPKIASNTLKWAVAEMKKRYDKFAEAGVRDLKGYNAKVSEAPDEQNYEKLPQIVIVIDELADLMMAAAKEVEESICRLAQLARAAGIHLIIATQRPSVDVVTGLIKANIPSRCALMVSSGTDSRTIIDSVGAEKLLGNGDMLFYPSGYVKPVRLQGAFVSDAEVQRVVDFWKEQANGNNYDDSISEYLSSQPEENEELPDSSGKELRDSYFEDAAKLAAQRQKASTSMLQRVFKVGYNRAARIMEQLEEAGIIGAEEGTKPRKVLVTETELENLLKNI